MARMLAKAQQDVLPQRCCDDCVFRDWRWRHLGRNPRFRKWARARDKASWKKEL